MLLLSDIGKDSVGERNASGFVCRKFNQSESRMHRRLMKMEETSEEHGKGLVGKFQFKKSSRKQSTRTRKRSGSESEGIQF